MLTADAFLDKVGIFLGASSPCVSLTRTARVPETVASHRGRAMLQVLQEHGSPAMTVTPRE